MPAGSTEYNIDYIALKRWLIFNRALRLHSKKKVEWPEIPASQIAILLVLSYKGPSTATSLKTELAFLCRGAQLIFIQQGLKDLEACEMVADWKESKRKKYHITLTGRNYLNSLEIHAKTTRLDK